MRLVREKLRYWFGFFIVIFGTFGASYALEIEESIYRKNYLHASVQYRLLDDKLETSWVSRKPSDFGLTNISVPEDVSQIMNSNGLVELETRVTLCVFGAVPLFGCDLSGSGMGIYQSEDNLTKFVAVQFEPKRHLTGCKLTVTEVIEVDVLSK